MLQSLDNLNYASEATVLFQRLTVILSEGLLLWAAARACTHLPPNRRLLTLFLVAAHPGLIMVDHIHFQYNGILLGLLILALWSLARGDDFTGAALFAALLCAKHIYLYAAPAFFVQLLRRRCTGRSLAAGCAQFAALGGIVCAIFCAALGPFVAAGQLRQLAGRLFPVSRGLCHAYWAPNFWALYAAADKALAGLLLRTVAAARHANMTGGAVAAACMLASFRSWIIK